MCLSVRRGTRSPGRGARQRQWYLMRPPPGPRSAMSDVRDVLKRSVLAPSQPLRASTPARQRRARTFPSWGLTKGYLIRPNPIMIRVIRDRLYADLEILYNFGFSRGGPRCPPRPRIWRPRPIRKHPKFSKAPLRGAEILFLRGGAKKKLARKRKKWVRTRVRTRFQLILAPFF